MGDNFKRGYGPPRTVMPEEEEEEEGEEEEGEEEEGLGGGRGVSSSYNGFKYTKF